jgi:hypothetical protein
MKTAIAVLLLFALAAPLAAGPVEIVQTGDGYLFTEGDGTPVLFYQSRPTSLDGQYMRANYVHPLYDLDGNVLTEDFPADHPHHRGIFWAWHQVLVDGHKAGDSWMTEDFQWDVELVEVIPDDGVSAALEASVTWSSPQIQDDTGQPRPLVGETAIIRVHRAEPDYRMIDFEIRLLALQPDVYIGGSEDEKGYGGFSPRIRLPEDIRFVGQAGELTPEVTAVRGGPWLDMTARFGPGDSTSGIAILQHPSLPGFPQPWILRSGNSMQNPVFPGRDPVSLSTEAPLVLRYRLIVHRGESNREQLQQWLQEYAEE